MKSPPLSLVINFKEKKVPGTSKPEKVISAERLSEVEKDSQSDDRIR